RSVNGTFPHPLRRTGLAAFTASGSPPLVHLLAYVRSLPSHFLSIHRACSVDSLRVRCVPLVRLIPTGWGPSPAVLLLVCTAFPYSDSYAPSYFPGRPPTFIRLSPPSFHPRSHPPPV